jgi:hypothetical protein
MLTYFLFYVCIYLQICSYTFSINLKVSSVALAPKNLPVWILVQTYAFVTFNKVITAQYFTWYVTYMYVCM